MTKYQLILFYCLLSLSSTFAQFTGGDGDGYIHSGTGTTSVNEQEFYCYGGDGDGVDQATLFTAVNSQSFYCNGGDEDGYDFSSSGIVVQSDQTFYCSGGDGDGFSFNAFSAPFSAQTFYCSGGDGDGHNFEKLGPVVQFMQDYYCSGGPGDGFSHSGDFSPMADQSFYCLGDDGDGFDSESSGFLAQNDQSFYCQGGDQDGYYSLSSGITAPNDASFYCSGGNNDGFSTTSLFSTINNQYFYCYGSYRDGYDVESMAGTINDQYFYCYSSWGDGYTMNEYDGHVFGSPYFCYGGNGDGFDTKLYTGNVFGTNIFCLGGNGDGFSQGFSGSELFGVGIWTGITSTDWNTGTNWKHEIIPGDEHNVLIPAGCSNYPELSLTLGINVFGNIECKRLEISQEGALNHAGNLYVNGEMIIKGVYTNTYNSNNSQRIYSNGAMTISSTGIAKFGNQLSGTGITDLIVYNGGYLLIDGGTAEIDDQFRVKSGGTFNMTGGELFVHKYGEGSPFGFSYPAEFYIESGALGEISGGEIKICGRESDGDYHALIVEESGFTFSGNSIVSFENGVNSIHYNSGISTVVGVTLQNLTINKPGNTVSIYSDLDVEQEVKIEANSSLKVEPGFQINVGE